MKRWKIIIPVLFVFGITLACNENPFPPGDDAPGGDSALPNEPTTGLIQGGEPTFAGTGAPLKPVKFVNTGTLPFTVSPWTYAPPGGVASPSGPNPSTVVSPGGNPSSYLSLSLGTYTWCYWWELGDTNNDGMIEYAHALDGRSVLLDGSDSDSLEFSESVTLSAPTLAGDIPGKCDAAPTMVVKSRSALDDGNLLLSDDGSGGARAMFGVDFMDFGYAGGQAQLAARSPNLVLPAMYNQVIPADFSLEVDLTGFNAGNEGQYQVIFRSDDLVGGLAGYNIISLIPDRRSVEFGVWEAGWKVSGAAVLSDDSISLNAPLHFRLEAKGNEYTIFINGSFATGFVDGSITSPGILGMSITAASVPASFTYDNLQVHALP